MTKSPRRILIAAALTLGLATGAFLEAQSRGLRAIRQEDMKFPLKFLASPDFRGRSVPSPELDIAGRYIALTAAGLGLKPLFPGGSYTQDVPVEVLTISGARSFLRLTVNGEEYRFPFGSAFGAGRFVREGVVSGTLVFLGLGLSAPELNWDDCAHVDLEGKIAVIMDVSLSRDHPLRPEENRRLLMRRAAALRDRGAVGVVAVVNEEREADLAGNDLTFDAPERLRFPDVETGPGLGPTAASDISAAPFLEVEVRHAVAARLLGISRRELGRMFADLRQGRAVAPRDLPRRRLEISLRVDHAKRLTRNIVAYLEGRDSLLKSEYVVVSSHYDHLPPREGRIYPGADDNASGVVGLFAVARAMEVERPKRSVIFLWDTAEERGLIGSYYFVEHCPVPVEKISADLNLDMISRNDPGHLYVIGSNRLSTELDESIQAMNTRGIDLTLDYAYEDPGHRDMFFFRSDQYPFIRYGVPGVWFFCGTTADYHRESDVEAKVDYAKVEKVARLVYLVAMDIGNRPSLLPLDLNPEVTARGSENMKVDWLKAWRERNAARRSESGAAAARLN
jgi:hypothetical protein